MEAENTIALLFQSLSLGKILPPVTPVSGGLMHRMYRVNTSDRSYAVKHLNPDIMARSDAMENYRKAETLEKIIEDAGIPVVAAVTVNGQKMQKADGNYFYIFPWQNGASQTGTISHRNNVIRPEQFRLGFTPFSPGIRIIPILN